MTMASFFLILLEQDVSVRSTRGAKGVLVYPLWNQDTNVPFDRF